MKKILSILFTMIIVLSVTGCGGNKLVCKVTAKEDDYTTASTFTVKFDKDDIVTEAKMVGTMEFEDSDTASEYYQLMITYGASKDDMKLSGKKITYTQSEKITSGETKAEVKADLEEEGYICK